MGIDLSDYEQGTKLSGDYDVALATVQRRLAEIQVAYIVHRKSAIVLVEGWDAAGKGGTIQRLTARWDPRHFAVWPIAAPTAAEKERHFLWRFWSAMPGAAAIAVFDRSWYGRVLVERVEELISEKEWRRAYDEINEFESMQHANGTTLVKVFLHITQEEQDKRLAARLEHPWKRWKLNAEDFRNRARRRDYLRAMHEMFERTSTHAGPWRVVDGNDKRAARIAALTYIADRLERGVSMAPPELPRAFTVLARRELGLDIQPDDAPEPPGVSPRSATARASRPKRNR
ncbi:MAG: polyphosphate kinase [Myxococcales bacterium 68-20]|nr:polyphosphate kinase [Myxococcales bacterium]OJY16994.1 MAG: polyphosphate kinase [Myxococcales bacterium 68-20]